MKHMLSRGLLPDLLRLGRAGLLTVLGLSTAAATAVPVSQPPISQPPISPPPASAAPALAAPDMAGTDIVTGLTLAVNATGQLVVTALEDGGAAQQAGLQLGDRIVAVNGQAHPALSTVLLLLGGPAQGQVELSVQRGNEALLLSLPF
ncbi:PDZ domain-containing protein [Deinococcus cavernae]|uniref:PDZ domain-containing protein n=1 Tax=Deinococcus cavernae TaxID=2320857 RepID=A0A418V8J0_9DEIO|nr:PDZ domain-containing protein [Deinococcus cavernae]RJF72409.1 PDZ domain-containing protein [Deinococcus cavernae]